MRYLKSIVLVAFLSMAVLLVFDSCSTTKKTTKTKTRIIAAVLAVISTVSLTAFAATSVSAAETGKTAATAQLSDEEQKKKDFVKGWRIMLLVDRVKQSTYNLIRR